MATKLRRGFKKEAEDYAHEFREELNIEHHEPMCPWDLAEHLAIPILKLSELDNLPEEHRIQLRDVDPDCFSAVTVFEGRKRIVVHNDSHSESRQRANIAHELAHGVLGHPPAPPLNEYGCRNFNKEIEEEANWLGPALLVPKKAALHVLKNGIPVKVAADSYGVSKQLMSYRINASGARQHFNNSKRWKR